MIINRTDLDDHQTVIEDLDIGCRLLGDSATKPLDQSLAWFIGAGLDVDDTALAVLGLVDAIAERMALPDRTAAFLGQEEACYWTGIADHKTMWKAVAQHERQLGRVLLMSRGKRDELGPNGRPVAAEWDLNPWPDVSFSIHPSLMMEPAQVLAGLKETLAPRNALWDAKHAGRTSWRLLCRLIGLNGLVDMTVTGPMAAETLGVDRATGTRALKRLEESGLAIRKGRSWLVYMGLLRDMLDDGYVGYVFHDRIQVLDDFHSRVKAWVLAKQAKEVASPAVDLDDVD
jgi:hypothetical protein